MFVVVNALGVAVPLAARADPEVEKSFLLRVCTNGPHYVLASAERQAGEAQRRASRVLPNPTLSAEHLQIATPREEESETVVGISVPLGIGGRRFLLEDAADRWKDAAELGAQAYLVDAALDAREALVHVIADKARLAVARRAQTDIDAIASDIATLAKAGDVSRFEAFRQETTARAHGASVGVAEARFASERLKLEAFSTASVDLDALEIGQMARGEPLDGALIPRVAAVDARLSATKIEARAARRRWVPDLEIFAGYRALVAKNLRVGHGFALSLKLPITFFDHGQGEEAMANANAAKLGAEREVLVARQDADQKAARAASDALSTHEVDVAAAAADADQIVDQARTLYRAGESSMTEVLAALSSAETARLALIDVEERAAIARIDAMRAKGSLFDPALDRACRSGPR